MRDILEDAEGAAARGDVGPGKANREKDAQQFPKRFYKLVQVEEENIGWFLRNARWQADTYAGATIAGNCLQLHLPNLSLPNGRPLTSISTP